MVGAVGAVARVVPGGVAGGVVDVVTV